MRDRKEIQNGFDEAVELASRHAISGEDAELMCSRSTLETLLDIRELLLHPPMIIETAEVRPLSNERVILQINYNSYLLPNNLTAEDVATLIRLFDGVEGIGYSNEVDGESPKVEIRLIPQAEIKYPGEKEAPAGTITETYTPVSVPEPDQPKLTKHQFTPLDGDEEFCGIDGCHQMRSDEIHDV